MRLSVRNSQRSELCALTFVVISSHYFGTGVLVFAQRVLQALQTTLHRTASIPHDCPIIVGSGVISSPKMNWWASSTGRSHVTQIFRNTEDSGFDSLFPGIYIGVPRKVLLIVALDRIHFQWSCRLRGRLSLGWRRGRFTGWRRGGYPGRTRRCRHASPHVALRHGGSRGA